MSVRKIYLYSLNLVLALVANNIDMFDKEQVREEEARDFAKEINAIYEGVTSYGTGVDELFHSIGKKFLNPNWNQENEDEHKNEHEHKYRKKKACVIF